MIHLERSSTINASPEAVWSLIGRFMQIDAFAPLVTRVEPLTAGSDGVGAKRRCHFENGTSLVEEVIEWQDGRGFRVRLLDIAAMPLHEMQASVFVEPSGPGHIKVVWSADYRMKYGPLGWLLGQTMMRAMMGKIIDGNLDGLAKAVKEQESGCGLVQPA